MTKIKKAITIIAMLATITGCFAGCSDAGSGTNSTASKSDSTQSQAAEEEKEEKNEESEVKEEEAPAADIPSDYELPASPEIIVYQSDKEVFHYAGETTSEVKSMLKDMGVGDNGKVIKDYRLTVKVHTNNIKLDVNRLTDDMRVEIDGMEVNLDTMNAIASDGVITTDTNEWKPDDFKTKPYAKLQFIVSGKTGNVTGCIIQLNNVPEN